MAWRGRAVSCVGAVLGLGLACDGGNGESNAALETISGGWIDEAEHRFVCVAPDGRMWLGDSASELDGSNPCTVDESGSAFHCVDADDASSFEGSLDVSGNALALEIAGCGGEPAECRATYVRDPSVTCD